MLAELLTNKELVDVIDGAPVLVEYPAGTILGDHEECLGDDHCWRLCVLPIPVAKPADDACAKKVDEWLAIQRAAKERKQKVKSEAHRERRKIAEKRAAARLARVAENEQIRQAVRKQAAAEAGDVSEPAGETS